MGLDLGQSQDYTAVCVVEIARPEFGAKPIHHLRHLQRFQLRTPYPTIVTEVLKMLEGEPLKGHTDLVIDGTGVGRPVVDLFTAVGLKPVPVAITGGDTPHREKGWYRIPKRDLVGILQVLFQTKRLLIAEGLPEGPVFVKELLNFQVKISESGHDSYNAREGEHDDLLLAAALASWRAERPKPPEPSVIDLMAGVYGQRIPEHQKASLGDNIPSYAIDRE